MSTYNELLEEFEGLARSEGSVESLMQKLSQRVHQTLTRYNWVGFYLVENSVPKVLVLGPYVGSFTPLRRISLDSGLCGACASTGKIVLVNDVAKDPRYLAATPMVKGELVAPVFVKQEVVAEIDVESYFANTFQREDVEFVVSCAALVGRYMEKNRRPSAGAPAVSQSPQHS